MKDNNALFCFNSITSSLVKQGRYLSLAVIFLPSVFAAENVKLVEATEVESWHQGATHTIHCEVETPNTYLLSSHNSARLKWVLPEGSKVTGGQLIAEQDGYYIAQSIMRLKIEIESARVQQDYTASEYKRIHLLNEQNMASSSRLNDMHRLSMQANLSHQQLKQRLEELQHREKNLQHFSPVNGQVLKLESQPGEYLNDGQTILRLQPIDNKELVCELPLKKYRQHNLLNEAKFTLNGNIDLTLNRNTLSLKEDSQTLALYLRADKSSKQSLLLGERLQVVVSYHNQDISRVPHDALELADDGYYVWKLNDAQSVNRLAVDIISTHNDYFLVKSPLQEGDHVVTFGKQGLTEEQQVKLSLEGNKENSL